MVKLTHYLQQQELHTNCEKPINMCEDRSDPHTNTRTYKKKKETKTLFAINDRQEVQRQQL